ncbi:hypothetical protein BGZ49_002078, partial [Haplosporangium sp. Z 27]
DYAYTYPAHMKYASSTTTAVTAPSTNEIDSTKRQRPSISPNPSPSPSSNPARSNASIYGDADVRRDPPSHLVGTLSVAQRRPSARSSTVEAQGHYTTSPYRSQHKTSPSVSSSSSSSPSPTISNVTAASTPLPAVDPVAAVTKGTASASISDPRPRYNSNQGFTRLAVRSDFKDPVVDRRSTPADYSERIDHTGGSDSFSPRGGLVQSVPVRDTAVVTVVDSRQLSPSYTKTPSQEPVLSFRNPHHSNNNNNNSKTFLGDPRTKRGSLESSSPNNPPESYRFQRDQYQDSLPHHVHSNTEEQRYQQQQRQPQSMSLNIKQEEQHPSLLEANPQSSSPPRRIKNSPQAVYEEERKMLHREWPQESQGYNNSGSSSHPSSSMRANISPVNPSPRQPLDTIPHSPPHHHHPHYHHHPSHPSLQQRQQQYSPPLSDPVRESDHRYARPDSRASVYSNPSSRQQDVEQQMHPSHRHVHSKDSSISNTSMGSNHSRHMRYREQDQGGQYYEMNSQGQHRHPYYPPVDGQPMQHSHPSGSHMAQPSHPMGHPQSPPPRPPSRHVISPTHGHTRYASQQYYHPREQVEHSGRRSVMDSEGTTVAANRDWNDVQQQQQQGYSRKNSGKMGGSEGILHASSASESQSQSQWKNSFQRGGVRPSASESDLQSIDPEQTRENPYRHQHQHQQQLHQQQDELNEDEIEEEGEEGEENGESEGELEEEYDELKEDGQQRRFPNPQRHHRNDMPRDGMYRNQPELRPRDVHPYDYPYPHHQAPPHPPQQHGSHQSHLNQSHRAHPYMHPYHQHSGPQHQPPPPQQQQQQGSALGSSSSSSSTTTTTTTTTGGPNRRGPYMSRQRAILAGLETTTPSSRYQCQYCQKRFSRPSSLRIHTYSHTGERPFKCSEEGCGRQFSVQSNMRRHLRVHRLGRMRSEFTRE